MLSDLFNLTASLKTIGLEGLSYRANKLFALASEERRDVFALLLACTRALADIAQSYHWRTQGANFYEDHLLFERIYNDVNAMVDRLAEKGVGVSDDDSLAEVNLQVDMIAKLVHEHAPESANEENFPETLLEYTKNHIKLIEELLKKLKEAGESSDGIENLLQELADKHEEHAYLLSRRVAKDQPSGDLANAAEKVESNSIFTQLTKIADDLDHAKEYVLANRIDDVMLHLVYPGKDEIISSS